MGELVPTTRSLGAGRGGVGGHSGALGKRRQPWVLTCCTGSCSMSSGSQTSVSTGFLPTFRKWWDRRGRAWGVHTAGPQDLGLDAVS